MLKRTMSKKRRAAQAALLFLAHYRRPKTLNRRLISAKPGMRPPAVISTMRPSTIILKIVIISIRERHEARSSLIHSNLA